MARSDAWPAIGYEQLTWNPRDQVGAATRADHQRSYGTYRAAIPAMIAGLSVQVPSGLAGEVDDGTAELARYDAELAGRAKVLDSIMLRSESAASSRIENLTASARSIALAELGDTTKPNASLIVANAHAMRKAIELAAELSPTAVLAMHDALLRDTDPLDAGRWREQPVWIGTSSLSPIDAEFVGPTYGRIPALIEDVLAYARQIDQPVLVQAAVAHAQFETIHPFTDGNGRTGRALLHAMLRHHRAIRHVTLPVSAGLLHDVSGYHDALTAYRAGDPFAIIQRVVDAAFRAIRNGRTLAAEIERIQSDWQERLSARRDSAVWRVADMFLVRPVLDVKEVSRQLEMVPSNVHRHLDRLAEVGILTAGSRHQRGGVWRADLVLSALDAFSARAGRRTGG